MDLCTKHWCQRGNVLITALIKIIESINSLLKKTIMTNLKNKVALITGSARGLGKAIAERYAALGADIVINYSRDRTSADEVVNNIQAMGARVIAVQADVT